MSRLPFTPKGMGGAPMNYRAVLVSNPDGSYPAQMLDFPRAPDNSPIPVEALIYTDVNGNIIPFPSFGVQVAIETYGGSPTSLDNTAALAAAIARVAALGGGEVTFGSGIFQFASAALAARVGYELPSNITISGRGVDITTLQITGTTECYLFLNEGCHSNITLRNFTAIGNNQASDNSIGGFFYCTVLAGSATASVKNVRIENVALDNFKGDTWFKFYCSHATYTISYCGLETVEIRSRSGNCRNPNNIGVRSDGIEFFGDEGLITKCYVRNLTGDFTWIKAGIVFRGKCQNNEITRPNLYDNFQGAGLGVAEQGAYGVALYGTTATAFVDTMSINNPQFTRPFTCGIYAADAKHVQINNPICIGQEDTNIASIPKGAIALNGCNDVEINNPIAKGCAYNINITGINIPAQFDANMRITINGGTGYQATAVGVIIKGSVWAATSGGITFNGYEDTESVTAGVQLFPNVYSAGASSGAIVDIRFADCEIGSLGTAINANTYALTSPTTFNCSFDITNMIISRAEVYSIAALGVNSGIVRLNGIEFMGTPSYHLIMDATTNVDFNNLCFRGVPNSGINMDLPGTKGSLRNVSCPNLATAVGTGATQLGRNLPNWAQGQGGYVQDVITNLTGTTPNAYRRKGWMARSSGTTWDEDRGGLI